MLPPMSEDVDGAVGAVRFGGNHAEFQKAAEDVGPIGGTDEQQTDGEAEAEDDGDLHGHNSLQHGVDLAAEKNGYGNESKEEVGDVRDQGAVEFGGGAIQIEGDGHGGAVGGETGNESGQIQEQDDAHPEPGIGCGAEKAGEDRFAAVEGV